MATTSEGIGATVAPMFNWGCIGTGNIAVAMAQQLTRMPNARKEAICSASGKPASAIERERLACGYARALSLEELVNDPAIHIVYVASANNAHAKHCLAALRGGKHVLCEKPLTLSAREAEDVFAEAQRQGLLLSDGTFSAYLPACDVIRERLHEIGRVRRVELNKKIRIRIMEESPIINCRELGGGLFDGCGSYTTHMLCVLFGVTAISALRPEDIEVVSVPGPTGAVDWDTTVTISIGDAVAVLTHRASNEARPSVVQGEHGSMQFVLPRLEEVVINGEEQTTSYGGDPLIDLPDHVDGAPHGIHPGLGVEASLFQFAVAAGASGPGTLALPLAVMRAMAHAMDLIRHRIPTHINFQPKPAL